MYVRMRRTEQPEQPWTRNNAASRADKKEVWRDARKTED